MYDSDDGSSLRKRSLREDQSQKNRSTNKKERPLTQKRQLDAWNIEEDSLLSDYLLMNMYRFFNHRDYAHKLRLFDKPASNWIGSKNSDQVKSHIQKVFSSRKNQLLSQFIDNEQSSGSPDVLRLMQVIYEVIVQSKRPLEERASKLVSKANYKGTFSSVTQLERIVSPRPRSESFTLPPENELDESSGDMSASFKDEQGKTEDGDSSSLFLRAPISCNCHNRKDDPQSCSGLSIEDRISNAFENAIQNPSLKHKIELLKSLNNEAKVDSPSWPLTDAQS